MNELSFWLSLFFSELCWGKVAYSKSQQMKKEEWEGVRGEAILSSNSKVNESVYCIQSKIMI